MTRINEEHADDKRWRAMLHRNGKADLPFYYAVRTTGVYSRPSCGARTARRENIVFFATPAAAEADGYRPCRRCRPDEATVDAAPTAAVGKACRIIDATRDSPSLEDLATEVGFSRFHFHRMFKAVTGLTPHAYIAASRSQRVWDELTRSSSVTDAIYDAGYNSNGRFYSVSSQILGMTPTEFRAGGEGVRIRYHVGSCSIGIVLVGETDKGVCAVLIGAGRFDLVNQLQTYFPKASLTVVASEVADRLNDALSWAEPPLAARSLPPEVLQAVVRQRIREALRCSGG